MNKGEFINYISEKNSCTKVEAEKVIDMFTSSVIDAIAAGNEISLIGFGNFSHLNYLENLKFRISTKMIIPGVAEWPMCPKYV